MCVHVCLNGYKGYAAFVLLSRLFTCIGRDRCAFSPTKLAFLFPVTHLARRKEGPVSQQPEIGEGGGWEELERVRGVQISSERVRVGQRIRYKN